MTDKIQEKRKESIYIILKHYQFCLMASVIVCTVAENLKNVLD